MTAPLWLTPKPALLAAVVVLSAAFESADGTRWAEVSSKLPARNRPLRFVRVKRTGGGLVDQATDRARLLVECYARSTAEVEAMTATCRAALRNSCDQWVEREDDDAIYIRKWDNEEGPTDYFNPEVLEYERWQFTGDLFVAVNR